MTTTEGLAIIAVAWLLIGFTVAVLMRRAGHDFWVWLVLGTLLGPLAIPLAVERARYHKETSPGVAPGDAHGGLDIVAGIDGSSESLSAVASALSTLGPRVSSLTLVEVLDFDARDSVSGSAIRDQAMARLTTAARSLAFEPVRTAVLYGRPDRVLSEYASANGIELIVVGARGKGASKAMFGSVVARLVGGQSIPVFVGPAGGILPGGGAGPAPLTRSAAAEREV